MHINYENVTEVGNYKVLQHINPEGLSKTFKVKHKFTEEVFALKVVFASNPAEIQKMQQTFKRLAKGMSKLDNPNLITFKEFFVTEIEGHKCFVLVSEFFSGSELQSFFSKGKASDLSYEQVENIFKTVAGVVNDAHQMRYVDEHDMEVVGFPHGHVTPSNIMLNNDLELRLLDFKLTNRYTLSEEKSKNKILTEELSISKTNDIFQLGHLLYYLFAIDKNYQEYKLDNLGVSDLATKLDQTITSSKQRKLLSQLIYDSVSKERKSTINSVSQLLDRLEGKEGARSVKKLSAAKYMVAACLVVVAGIAISFPIMKSYLQQPTEVSETRGTIVKGEAKSADQVKIGEYYAYMIGNQAYQHMKPLSKPKQDVQKFIDILTEDYGFKPENIITKFDATRDDLYDGFEQVEKRVGENDNLLIFYAGHGQLDHDKGYWIPVEGKEKSRRDWISNTEIKDFLSYIVAKNVLVVSDACFGGSLLRSASTYESDTRTISKKRSRIALTSGSLESVPDKSVFIDELFWYLENNQDTLVYTSNIFAGIREGVVSNTTTDPGYGPIRDAGHQGGDFFFLRNTGSNQLVQ